MDNKYDLSGLTHFELTDKHRRVKGYVMQSRRGSNEYKHNYELLSAVVDELKRREEYMGRTYDCQSGDYNPKRKRTKRDYWEIVIALIMFSIIAFIAYWKGHEDGSVEAFDYCTNKLMK